MDLGLKDCKAFITGASRGLGKACAKALGTGLSQLVNMVAGVKAVRKELGL